MLNKLMTGDFDIELLHADPPYGIGIDELKTGVLNDNL